LYDVAIVVINYSITSNVTTFVTVFQNYKRGSSVIVLWPVL
jgi:hypothetical protein